MKKEDIAGFDIDIMGKLESISQAEAARLLAQKMQQANAEEKLLARMRKRKIKLSKSKLEALEKREKALQKNVNNISRNVNYFS